MEKRISADYVLNSLINRFGFKGLNNSTVFEHIGDAINLIGFGLAEKVVYKQVDVNFYKIAYPCDCITFYNAYYKGRKLTRKHCDGHRIGDNPFGWLETIITSNIKQITTLDIEATLQNEDTLDDRAELLRDVIQAFSIVDTYNEKIIDDSNWIKPNKNLIETSIENGNIYLEYSTFALDERGIPYLYDEQRYLDGIIYYCAAMIIQSGYEHKTISYPMAMANMETYMARARNYQKRLTPEQAEDFKSSWTNMLKGANDYFKFTNS